MTPGELAAEYLSESFVHRVTSSTPPVTSNVTEHESGGRMYFDVEMSEEPGDRIGQSLSAEMVTLIGGIRADFTSYGPRHPVRRALAQWERTCRRRHRAGAQWSDHTTGPLCGELLYAVANGSSIMWCSDQWSVSYPRAERLIAAGLRYIGDELERAQEAQLGIVHDRDRCDVCRDQDES